MTTFKDPWGYSKLETFEKCPQKFKYQFIDKLPQPGSAAMERGSKMHESIESYLNGWVKELIPACQSFQEAIDSLKTEHFVAMIHCFTRWKSNSRITTNSNTNFPSGL